MQVASIQPTVSYDVFEKIDVRVGTIERVEDSLTAENARLAEIIENNLKPLV